MRVRQRGVRVRRDVGGDRRVRDRQSGPALHGRGGLQRVRARAADRDDRGEPSTGGRPKVYEDIARCVHRERRLYGDGGEDWNRIGFTFWRYPAGNRLGWHNDTGGGRRGEFILFLHERWRPSWGGELMILDEDTTALDHSETGHESATDRMERILDTCPVSPTAIVPKPNRLVLVQAGTVHQIHRVDQTAKLERCTLTGFVSEHMSDRDRQETREKLAASLGAS